MKEAELQELKKMVDNHGETLVSLYKVSVLEGVPTTPPSERLNDLEEAVERLERTALTVKGLNTIMIVAASSILVGKLLGLL